MTDRLLRVATVQFEAVDRDKAANLAKIDVLATKAATEERAGLVCFHECCIPGYSYLQTLDVAGLHEIAEPVPGPSTEALGRIAKRLGVAIGAGLLEVVRASSISKPMFYNTYVVVDWRGNVVASQRKMNPFVSPHLSPGDAYNVFSLAGFKFGILICYDNNLPENVRCAVLRGAEIILMPHVTGGTASNQPGRGVIDRALWDNRHLDPIPLQREFHGLKGREWILRFVPCRAWENGIYAVFSNAVGVDYDTIKPGCSMIVDPCGNVVTECNRLGDDIATCTITGAALALASGGRYLRARRPDMYSDLVKASHTPSVTEPCWQRSWEDDSTRHQAPGQRVVAASSGLRGTAPLAHHPHQSVPIALDLPDADAGGEPLPDLPPDDDDHDSTHHAVTASTHSPVNGTDRPPASHKRLLGSHDRQAGAASKTPDVDINRVNKVNTPTATTAPPTSWGQELTLDDKILTRGGAAIRAACGAPGLVDTTLRWIVKELTGGGKTVDVDDMAAKKRFADFTGVVQVLMKPSMLREIRDVVLLQRKLVAEADAAMGEQGGVSKEYAW
eukprot:m.211032 g.211032  ORF g.211032 m.211032 type:complete len:559 (-) comp25351_c0_seq1:49-1725(-)